jgi:hypothetical protein
LTCLTNASYCFGPGGDRDHESLVPNGVGEKSVGGEGRMCKQRLGKVRVKGSKSNRPNAIARALCQSQRVRTRLQVLTITYLASRTLPSTSFKASSAALPLMSSDDFCLCSNCTFCCRWRDTVLFRSGCIILNAGRGGRSFMTPVACQGGRLNNVRTFAPEIGFAFRSRSVGASTCTGDSSPGSSSMSGLFA